MTDLSQVRVIIVGPQGSGKSWVKKELNKLFPDLLTVTVQTPYMEGERIATTVDSSGKIEHYFVNPIREGE